MLIHPFEVMAAPDRRPIAVSLIEVERQLWVVMAGNAVRITVHAGNHAGAKAAVQELLVATANDLFIRSYDRWVEATDRMVDLLHNWWQEPDVYGLTVDVHCKHSGCWVWNVADDRQGVWRGHCKTELEAWAEALRIRHRAAHPWGALPLHDRVENLLRLLRNMDDGKIKEGLMALLNGPERSTWAGMQHEAAGIMEMVAALKGAKS